MNARNTSAGYTMLELLLALAIVALIAVTAAPSVSASVDRMTLSADARELATWIRMLREFALDRQTDVVLTKAGGGNALAASNGAIIAVSHGTAVEFAGAGRDGPFVIRWNGSGDGVIRLERGGSSVRITAGRWSGRMIVEAVP